jgi:hypothetical protein
MIRHGALELKDPEEIPQVLPSSEKILMKIAR